MIVVLIPGYHIATDFLHATTHEQLNGRILCQNFQWLICYILDENKMELSSKFNCDGRIFSGMDPSSRSRAWWHSLFI